MRTLDTLCRLTAALCTVALLLITGPVAAQPEGLRGELLQDLDQLEEKYLGLADAMAGKYTWRPGEGVRSAGEVLMHVANANLFIPTIAGVEMPASVQRDDLQAREGLTDPAAVREALEQSFAHVRHAIESTPDAALDDPVTMFGQPATKRRVLTLLLTHMHEHLGQSIAYARTNDVVPPWSE